MAWKWSARAEQIVPTAQQSLKNGLDDIRPPLFQGSAYAMQNRDAFGASLTAVAARQLSLDDQRPELSFRSRVGRFRIGVIEEPENLEAISHHSSPELAVFRVAGSSGQQVIQAALDVAPQCAEELL